MNYDYLSKLEPEIRIFRFERTKECFSELSEEEVVNVLSQAGEGMDVILTGRTLPEAVRKAASAVYNIIPEEGD